MTAPKAASFCEISVLFLEAGEDPTLLLSDRWTLAVATELAAFQLTSDAIRDIDPAPGTSAIHATLSRMAGRLDGVVQSLISSIDNFDISKLERAITLISDITADLQKATELSISFCD